MTKKKPVIFISSTCYDLKQIRSDIRDFFEDNYGFETLLSEFDSFPIDPCTGTFENCLENVDKCADIFILIIGTRYGYVTEKGKSITNLEYLHAKAKGIPIYVFVDKHIRSNLPLWRANKTMDFSSIVDNPQIFEFVGEIYDESRQWIYEYENVKDIEITMKQQLGLIFSDGLKFKTLFSSSRSSLLSSDLPADAMRTLIEKPFAWEFKFLAYVLNDEFKKLNNRRWDLKYGIFDGHAYSRKPGEFLNELPNKLDEMLKLVHLLGVLMNTVIQDAMGDPGCPSDLEMMVYTAKKLAAVYERLTEWALYFKSIEIDDSCGHLIDLVSDIPNSVLGTIDEFVQKFYSEVTDIPDVDDNVSRHIDLKYSLEAPNIEEINAEIRNIANLLGTGIL